MSKKNIMIGSIMIFLFIVLGAVLKSKGGAGTEEWKQSTMRHLWRVAHVHGGLFGMLSLLFGLVIYNLSLKGKLLSLGSILSVIGAIVFPGSFFLAGFLGGKILFLSHLGGISMTIAWAILVYTIIINKKKA